MFILFAYVHKEAQGGALDCIGCRASVQEAEQLLEAHLENKGEYLFHSPDTAEIATIRDGQLVIVRIWSDTGPQSGWKDTNSSGS